MSAYLPLDKHFETKAIHTGFKPKDTSSFAVVPPVTLSSTFHQNDIRRPQHYKYSRYANPNREILEKSLAALEDAKYATCYSSGIGAVAMVCQLCQPGDEVLCIDDVYSGTHKYFDEVLTFSHGLKITYADLTDINVVEKKVNQQTKLVWLESLTNPMMKIVDIPAVVKKVKEKNPKAYVAVDNSFLTSYFLRPLDFGVDISMSSLTKYINGHSDVIMGVIVTNDEKLFKFFSNNQLATGATPSPFDCYLVLRGLRTLSLRMKAHMCNAYKVAKFLESHPKIEKVLYAGLETHQGHDIAKRLWSGCSGIMSFYLKGNLAESGKFLSSLKYISTCVSYGGYESVAIAPMTMSLGFIPKEKLEKKGISGNLIRLSVGLESIDTLIGDMKQALEKILKLNVFDQNGIRNLCFEDVDADAKFIQVLISASNILE